jgi:PTH1 family peptidyl-tRNA hydrolase
LVSNFLSLVVIGLGNKGKEYRFTRHNIGMRVIDAFFKKYGNKWNKSNLWYSSRVKVGKKEVILLKLRTFMNLSGEVLANWLKKYNLATNQILVVYDDLNLPLGKLRIKKKGSAGGHKGVKSIIDNIGEEFLRLKIGIAPLNYTISSSEWREFVLTNFLKEEEKLVKEEVIPLAVEAIEFILERGEDEAMRRYNSIR